MQLKQGTLLQGGKYRIEQVLGQGGFGITYLAENTMLEGKVAIKEFFFKEYCNRDEATSHVTIPTEGNRELVERFKQKFIKEARTIFKLNHPNIVAIHDIFEENGTAYYVMDYIEGESLGDRVKFRGAIPEAEAIGYIKEVSSALSYIHSKSINHLDIKPGNIMKRREDGKVLLIDFGVAKQYDAETSEGTTTTPVGISHGYSPAEQYRKNGVQSFSPQSDVYALAATFYKLLTGVTPPEAMDVLTDGLPLDDLHRYNVSGSSVSAIVEGMKTKPQRPQTISAWVGLLNNNLHTNSLHAHVDEPEVTIISTEETRLSVAPTNHVSANHEWVDLGLPSGTMWATCNVGASRPEESGDFFAWGETQAKSDYSEESYSLLERKAGLFHSIKYNYDSPLLDSQHDAASVSWGIPWRMPTKEEIEELRNSCDWTWTSFNGKKGYKVTGPSGNAIFLPAAGYRGGSSLRDVGVNGSYWSSSLHTDNPINAYSLDISSQEADWYYNDRYYGQSIRPVLGLD